MSGEETAAIVTTPVDSATLEGLELNNENYTVISAAEDAEAPADDVAGESGTVIEVPVAYTDLQTTGGEAIILQEAEDDDKEAAEKDTDEEKEDTDSDDDDDSDYDPMDDLPTDKKKVSTIIGRKGRAMTVDTEKCSICGATVTDLAIHIVNKHSASTPVNTAPVIVKSDPVKRPAEDIDPSAFGLKPRKRAYTKGKYQQIKPVLRFPCDACKHVSKTSDQLKKHMIMAHKGSKKTSWMFCGECEYATRVEEELVNHVKMHQLFSVLKDEMREGQERAEDSDEDEDDDETEAIIRAATGGKGLPPAANKYEPTPMNCGDCNFQTHYENELFEHLKMHLRKDANLPDETEEEEKLKKDIIDASVEQVTFYEEDDCLHCGLCSFSSKQKKNMLRHSNLVHGVVINDKDYQGGATITVKQTAYHCTLCKFRGANKEELAQHRKRTIHNKYGGVTAIDPIAEAEERKARIRNNCL